MSAGSVNNNSLGLAITSTRFINLYIRDAHRAITKDMASTLVFNSRHPEYKVTVNVKSKWHQQIPGWDIYTNNK